MIVKKKVPYGKLVEQKCFLIGSYPTKGGCVRNRPSRLRFPHCHPRCEISEVDLQQTKKRAVNDFIVANNVTAM